MGKGSILPALLLASLSLFAVISCGGARSSPSSSPPLNPVFMSSPPSAADEASPYVYTARATDPANNIINYQLTTAPTGAGLSGATITWIPSGMQSRQPNSFAITATTAVGDVRSKTGRLLHLVLSTSRQWLPTCSIPARPIFPST